MRQKYLQREVESQPQQKSKEAVSSINFHFSLIYSNVLIQPYMYLIFKFLRRLQVTLQSNMQFKYLDNSDKSGQKWTKLVKN